MSSYTAITKHPNTGEYKKAQWLDDYYGRHAYGVQFEGEDMVYNPEVYDMETREPLTLKRYQVWADPVKRPDNTSTWILLGETDDKEEAFMWEIKAGMSEAYDRVRATQHVEFEVKLV